MRRPPSANLLCIAAPLGALLCACSLPEDQADFSSNLPSDRALATALAARGDEPADIPDLIAQLDSSDAAVRLLAQRALQKRTGESFGYHYADGEAERSAAVARWADWYRQQEAAR